MAGVLEGIKVVSMEQWVVAPHASVVLADWGADVIKVEPPTAKQERGLVRDKGSNTKIKRDSVKVEVDAMYQFINRGKRSLVVDLKKDSGRDILCQLVQIRCHNHIVAVAAEVAVALVVSHHKNDVGPLLMVSSHPAGIGATREFRQRAR